MLTHSNSVKRAQKRHQQSVERRNRAAFRGKTFGRHGRPMDGNAKARVIAFAKAYTAQHKTGRQHCGPITQASMRVLYALLYGFHNAHSGMCFPSYQAIATAANCKRSSVHEAINILEGAGILSWVHGLKRITEKSRDAVLGAWRSASRVVRTTNVFTFNDPNPSAARAANNKPSENRSGTGNPKSLLNLSTVAATESAQKPPVDNLGGMSLGLLERLLQLGNAIAEKKAEKQS